MHINQHRFMCTIAMKHHVFLQVIALPKTVVIGTKCYMSKANYRLRSQWRQASSKCVGVTRSGLLFSA